MPSLNHYSSTPFRTIANKTKDLNPFLVPANCFALLESDFLFYKNKAIKNNIDYDFTIQVNYEEFEIKKQGLISVKTLDKLIEDKKAKIISIMINRVKTKRIVFNLNDLREF